MIVEYLDTCTVCAVIVVHVVGVWHMEGHIYVLALYIMCVNFFELLNVENAVLGVEVAYSVLAVMTNGSTIIVHIILLLVQTVWPVDFVPYLSCCR
jgi:hypothetical protein